MFEGIYKSSIYIEYMYTIAMTMATNLKRIYERFEILRFTSPTSNLGEGWPARRPTRRGERSPGGRGHNGASPSSQKSEVQIDPIAGHAPNRRARLDRNAALRASTRQVPGMHSKLHCGVRSLLCCMSLSQWYSDESRFSETTSAHSRGMLVAMATVCSRLIWVFSHHASCGGEVGGQPGG